MSNVAEQIAEQTKIKQDAEFRLNFYKKHNLEAKLQKRLGFDADIRKTKEGVNLVEALSGDIRELLAKHEDDLRNFIGYVSINNADFFKDFDTQFSSAMRSIEIIKAELAKIEITYAELKKKYEKLITTRQSLADEFAAIERTLAEELKTANGQNISSDEFLVLKKQLNTADTTLTVLNKSSDQKTIFRKIVDEELQKLNELWLEEFNIIKSELEAVSRNNSALQFSVGFKEDRNAFRDYFKSIFKGSGVRDATFQNIVDEYQDFASIYADLESARRFFGSNPENFIRLLEENWKNLLTYQVPNKFTITYRGVKLAHHSLGQRASALILFVLGQRENDVIIIDQPEDDLDNQTIYEDVITLVRELKPRVQFIFATHNPNIPVLGDAEQIHACSFEEGKGTVQSGGLDDPAQQKNIIGIMEGGKEAFERRKEIYQIWKS